VKVKELFWIIQKLQTHSSIHLVISFFYRNIDIVNAFECRGVYICICYTSLFMMLSVCLFFGYALVYKVVIIAYCKCALVHHCPDNLFVCVWMCVLYCMPTLSTAAYVIHGIEMRSHDGSSCYISPLCESSPVCLWSLVIFQSRLSVLNGGLSVVRLFEPVRCPDICRLEMLL